MDASDTAQEVWKVVLRKAQVACAKLGVVVLPSRVVMLNHGRNGECL